MLLYRKCHHSEWVAATVWGAYNVLAIHSWVRLGLHGEIELEHGDM